MLRCAVALLLIACGSPSSAEPHEPAWLAPIRDARPQTFDHLQSLTDAAGPRLAGSPGDRLAVQWGLNKMRALGLENVRAEPVTVHVWVRGEERVEVIAPVPHRLAATALGNSVGTPPGGIDAEIVRAGSLDELRALPRDRVQGKIAFVDQIMERARDGHGYGDAIEVRRNGASVAAASGALAVIIRSIGTDSSRFAHTGMMRYEDGVAQIPAASISNADADVLARWIANGRQVRIHMELGCHDEGEAQSANVIGEVPGTDANAGIVLLGAHLDSWDLGRGAIDDGAGVAIMLEAARRIRHAPRPARTIRVVLFANEENGLAGGRAYAAAHASERHIVAIEADFGDGRAIGLRTPNRSAGWERVATLLEPMGVEWDRSSDEPEGGADIGPLHEDAHVPLADVDQDGTRYFDIHHTANDVLTQIDRESLDHAMRAFAIVAYSAASDTEGIR
jgi:carboxypeptidase Q